MVVMERVRQMLGIETRQQQTQDYTDQIIAAAVSAASSAGGANVASTAAARYAAGLIGRALSSAKVEPAHEAVTPDLLYRVGEALVVRGESLWAIVVKNGNLSLYEASHSTPMGTSPTRWDYELTLPAPEGEAVLRFPREAVCHFTWSTKSGSPWRGISPLATLSGEALAELEQTIGYEAAQSTGQVVLIPQAGEQDGAQGLRDSIAKLKGRTAVLDLELSDFTESSGGSGGKGYSVLRLGPQFGASFAPVRSELSRAVLSACGVPASMVDPSAGGAGTREGYRQWMHGTVAPIGKRVAAELTAKLEPDEPFTLNFDSLFAADISSRARAYGSLTAAGLDPDLAGKLVGITDDTNTDS